MLFSEGLTLCKPRQHGCGFSKRLQSLKIARENLDALKPAWNKVFRACILMLCLKCGWFCKFCAYHVSLSDLSDLAYASKDSVIQTSEVDIA